eukprot:6667-Heterococcus_DN1.PRE.1
MSSGDRCLLTSAAVSNSMKATCATEKACTSFESSAYASIAEGRVHCCTESLHIATAARALTV